MVTAMTGWLREVVVALLLMAAGPAFAQGAYHTKQVRIVVPLPAGGSADVLCRLVGEKLGAEPQGDTAAATAAFIREEEARWRAVIKSANVTLE